MGATLLSHDPQTFPVGGRTHRQSLKVLGIIHIGIGHRADKNASEDGPMPGKVLTIGSAICSIRGPWTSQRPVPFHLLCCQLIGWRTASPSGWHCWPLIHIHVLYKARFSRKEEKPWQATWVYFQPHKINIYQGSV